MANPKWFTDMSRVQQKAYLKAHPNSKYQVGNGRPSATDNLKALIPGMKAAGTALGLGPRAGAKRKGKWSNDDYGLVGKAVNTGLHVGLTATGLSAVDGVRKERIPNIPGQDKLPLKPGEKPTSKPIETVKHPGQGVTDQTALVADSKKRHKRK